MSSEFNQHLLNILGYKKDLNGIVQFTKSLTIDYDESHDYLHHLAVHKNALMILMNSANSFTTNLIELITYASLLHDTIDHKYPLNISEKKTALGEFLNNNIPGNVDNVLWIINNMSYSKEVKFGYPIHQNQDVQLARDIVSDADKLEAIGYVGIVRCKKYILSLNPKITETQLSKDVVQHCYDKLLKIKDYLRTDVGKEMAIPLHKTIVDFVDKNK